MNGANESVREISKINSLRIGRKARWSISVFWICLARGVDEQDAPWNSGSSRKKSLRFHSTPAFFIAA